MGYNNLKSDLDLERSRTSKESIYKRRQIKWERICD